MLILLHLLIQVFGFRRSLAVNIEPAIVTSSGVARFIVFRRIVISYTQATAITNASLNMTNYRENWIEKIKYQP